MAKPKLFGVYYKSHTWRHMKEYYFKGYFDTKEEAQDEKRHLQNHGLIRVCIKQRHADMYNNR